MADSINKSVKLQLVSNQRRDPKRLQAAYDEAKSLYPWKGTRELQDHAKEIYARQEAK